MISSWTHFCVRLLQHHKTRFVDLGRVEDWFLSNELQSISIDRPIFICGLARAGSTILLELLAEHSETVSHQYRDFPFVHFPVIWNTFLEQAEVGSGEARERFHKDRIEVTPNSPEAMEEPIWMAFCSDTHTPCVTQVLDGQTRYPSFEKFYRRHIKKLQYLRGGSRYLAKNNYNVTRIEYLHSIFPDAKFIIPVRDPVHHIASSMKQHRLFTKRQREMPRIRPYLREEGHFEFGLDRVPIHTGSGEDMEEVLALWEQGQEKEGWLMYWKSIYRFVADLLEGNDELRNSTFIVSYNDLCERSFEVLKNLYDFSQLSAEENTVENQSKCLSKPDYYETPFSAHEKKQIRSQTDSIMDRLLGFSKYDATK